MKRCPQCRQSFQDELTHCPDDGTELVDHTPPRDAFIGRVLAGRYEVLELLGRGGFGVVYKVRDRKMDDVVAVKVFDRRRFTDQEAQQAIQRFRREGVLLRRLGKRTNNIVIVYDFEEDEEEELIYFTMDYVEGTTLTEILAEEGALPLPRVLELGLQLCQALKAAHAEGIVHRDLKLENVMVTRDGDREVVKVLDFGIAKMVGSQSLTNLAMGVPGTAGFAPPEQLQRPEDIDHRTDLFALGVVLYGLVTGHGPWSGEPISEPTSSEKIWDLIRSSLEDAPIPIRRWRSDVPKPLDTLICKLLEKDQARRVQSAELVEEELKKVRRMVTGQPETGKSLGVVGLFQASSRRLGIPPVAAAGGLLALLVALVVVVRFVTGMTPSISLESFEEAAQAGRVLEARIRSGEVDAVLRDAEGSVGNVAVRLNGVWVQELARRLEEQRVPLRLEGQGGLSVHSVVGPASWDRNQAGGPEGGTPAQPLPDPATLPPAAGASLSLEGTDDACAPCSPEEEVQLAPGRYSVQAAGVEWTLSALMLRDRDGVFQDEDLDLSDASLFLPEGASLELISIFTPTETRVLLTRAGEAVSTQEPETAMNLVDEVLATHPEHPWALALRDSVLFAAAAAAAPEPTTDAPGALAAEGRTGDNPGETRAPGARPGAETILPEQREGRAPASTPAPGAGEARTGGVPTVENPAAAMGQPPAGDSSRAAGAPSGGDSSAAGSPSRSSLSASDLVIESFRFVDDQFLLQGSFTAAGSENAPLCVASIFGNSDEEGSPFPDTDGSFGLAGRVAVTQDHTPGRDLTPVSVDLALPVNQLHVQRGTFRVLARTGVWPGSCDAADTSTPPLTEAVTAPICIVRYPAGWGLCRGS